MQALIVFKGGTQAIVEVEKVNVVQRPNGKIDKFEWTNPDDAYTTLRNIDPAEIAAVIMIKNMDN